MAKTYTAAGGGFKRIEAALRDAANKYRDAITEIDCALAAKRSPEEIAFLNGLRTTVGEIQDASRGGRRQIYLQSSHRIDASQFIPRHSKCGE